LGAHIVIGVSLGLHDGEPGAPASMFQLVCRAIHAAQNSQLDNAVSHADFVLTPAVQFIAWNAVERIDEALHAGASAARSELESHHQQHSELRFQGALQ
jgi:hypothetical protein